MDFGLSQEQRLLQDVFRSYLAERVPIARVRQVSETGAPAIAALWSELAELDACGVLIPQEFGGSGLTLLDASLVAQELGRAATPAPFLATAVMAPVALLEAGTPQQQAEWLPKIATGQLRLGVAATETYSRRENAKVWLDGGQLRGKALMALDAAGAEAFLVAAGASDLLLVAADAPGLSVVPLTAVDRTRAVAELVFDGVAATATLGGPGGAQRAIERMLDAGRVALTGDIVGACDAMLEQAVAYAGQRKQFGRIIGSFQAVKHMCAETAAELEPTRSLFWYAAHAFDALPDEAPLVVAHAKAHASETGIFVARTSTEVHGGVGFSDEQNLHIWFKRIGVDRQLLGSPDLLRERAARLQGWRGLAGVPGPGGEPA
jgi:alkylation response protein AidB-like acyl-CoA dehydrogenase